MKNVKRLISIFIVMVLLTSSLLVPASSAAKETMHNSIDHFADNDMTVLFPEEPSQFFRDHVMADLAGEAESGDTTDGLLCTLFGHNYETSIVVTVTHRVRPTPPRCLQNTYEYKVCTRCGYTLSTLLASVYIYCCS